MTEQLLADIIIIFSLSVVVVYICNRIKIPSIIGFLITGAIVGPHALSLIRNINEVDILAEIGVILILFVVGIEFSLKKIVQIKKVIFIGGSIQVLLTILMIFLFAKFSGIATNPSIFIGFITVSSSTAVIMKILQNSDSSSSVHGNVSLSISVFQDILVVPMMLMLPLLAGSGEVDLFENLFSVLIKLLGLLLFSLIATRYLIPYLMLQISRTRIRELFLLAVISLCLLVILLTHLAGLSLALGAFIAGLIISETDYNHQALGDIVPFKEVFASIFFVSVGMLLDISFVFENIGIILILTFIIITVKIITSGIAMIVLGYSLRTALLVGFLLFNIGEIAFILSKAGFEINLLTAYQYQIFLAITVITMSLTPIVIMLSPKAVNFIEKFDDKRQTEENNVVAMKDHLIIIGYGINGRNLARAAKLFGIEYIIIEMNPDTVRTEKAKGENILYGDAVKEEVLKSANIETARIVVVAISDSEAVHTITRTIHSLNHHVFLIVRTRFLSEMQTLHELGAHYVVPEEFETSIEIFSIVLSKYKISKEEIHSFTEEIRANDYNKLLYPILKRNQDFDSKQYFSQMDFNVVKISKGSKIANNTIADIDIRAKYELTVLAIRRANITITNPSGDYQLIDGDELILLGSNRDATRFYSYVNQDSNYI